MYHFVFLISFFRSAQTILQYSKHHQPHCPKSINSSSNCLPHSKNNGPESQFKVCACFWARHIECLFQIGFFNSRVIWETVPGIGVMFQACCVIGYCYPRTFLWLAAVPVDLCMTGFCFRSHSPRQRSTFWWCVSWWSTSMPFPAAWNLSRSAPRPRPTPTPAPWKSSRGELSSEHPNSQT